MPKINKPNNIIFIGANLYKDYTQKAYLERVFPYIKDATHVEKFPLFSDDILDIVLDDIKKSENPTSMFVLSNFYEKTIECLDSRDYKKIEKSGYAVYTIDNSNLIVKNISIFDQLPKTLLTSDKSVTEFKLFGKKDKMEKIERSLEGHAVIKIVLPTWYNVEIKDAEGEQILIEKSKELDIKIVPVRSIRGALVQYLSSKSKKLTFAESCTGGLLASKFTAIPGVSEVLDGSMVTYSNKIKHKWLDVKEETLDKYGAVSKECVVEMVKGIKNKSDANIAIAISGIAGPEGGTEDKPVGTVYIAILNEDNLNVKKFNFNGDRNFIQELAARSAIEMIVESEPEFFNFF